MRVQHQSVHREKTEKPVKDEPGVPAGKEGQSLKGDWVLMTSCHTSKWQRPVGLVVIAHYDKRGEIGEEGKCRR